MKNLKELLDSTENISGYRISEKNTVSYELFFVHKDLETIRSTDAVSTSVTVYVEHDGKTGDSTFKVYRSMTDDNIRAKIAQAHDRALLVSNEPYALPEGGTLEEKLPTDLDKYEPAQLGSMIADAVYAADDVPGGSINALEIFIYRDTLRVVNSRGIDKKQTTNRVMIEAIPTYTDDKQSVELYEDYRFTRFDAGKLTAEIAGKMKEVRDRAVAVKPEGEMKINVALRPFEIGGLMREFAYDLSYASVYSHANMHKIGDDLQQGDGDKITLTMKAVIEGSERSAYFDEDGMELTDTAIIKDGIVCGNFGSSRYGQYLKVEKPSGSLGCMKLEAGDMTDEEMNAEPYLECVSMSGLQLDLYNDYIGGEIRLAYYHDGEKVVPMTGISMSAKLSEVLATVKLSEKTDVIGGYEGPVRLLMRGVSVL